MTALRHAELGASRAERWTHCPGSVRMSRAVPDVDTPYAAEGREAHAKAEADLRGNAREYAGVDDEMEQAVASYVAYARSLIQPNVVHGVEVTFDLTRLFAPFEMYGTADFVAYGSVPTYDAQVRVLHVVDFKYGKGVPVEVNGNAQLLYYVLGALLWAIDLHYFAGRIPQTLQPREPKELLEAALAIVDEIVVSIVQPRASHVDGPIRTAHVSKQEVREYAAHLLLKAGATLDENAPLHAGAWCKFCPAQAFCPEVKRYAVEVAQHDFAVVEPPAPETLPIEVVASLLSKVDVLEHWVKSLERRVIAELEAGRPVPGWKLVAKRPSRVWNQWEKVVGWWRQHSMETGDDVLFNHTPKSPAQVEAMVGKKNLPAELYSLVSTGVTLAPEHDRRQAVKAGPQEDFKALPPGEPNA